MNTSPSPSEHAPAIQRAIARVARLELSEADEAILAHGDPLLAAVGLGHQVLAGESMGVAQMYEDAARRIGLTQEQCDRVKRAARRIVARTRLVARAQGRFYSEASIHDLCIAEAIQRVATYRSCGNDPGCLADWVGLPELAPAALEGASS